MKDQSLTTTPNLLTVRQFAHRHPAFTEASLRYLIFHSDSNGFNDCILRIGSRVLLDEEVFFSCAKRQQKNI